MVKFSINEKEYPWFTRMPIIQWREIRQFVYERDGGLCQYCGKVVRLDECHIHHVLELSENGSNHPSNLKTLCKDCHKNRHPFMKTAKEKYITSLDS
jgi:5-methylcytosine-specific restriction endonuclease McrA